MVEPDDGLTLSSLDFLGDTDDLRVRAQQELDQLNDAGGGAVPRHGADSSDSVWVALDERGRLTDVDISRHWRERLGPSALPDALFQAYTDAVRLAAAGSALRRGSADPTARTSRFGDGGVGVDGVGPAGDLSPYDARWRAATWAALDGVRARLEEIRSTRLRGHAADDEEELSSPRGLFTVRLSGGGVVGISGDVRLIGSAESEELRREAMAVLRDAEASYISPR